MFKRLALIVAIVVALVAVAAPAFADSPSSEVDYYFEADRWGFVVADDLPPEGTYSVTFYVEDAQLELHYYEFIVEFIYLWDDENEYTYGRTSDCYIPDLDATLWVECVMGYNEDDIRGISFTAFSVPSNLDVWGFRFSSYSPSDPGETPGSAVDQVLAVFTGIGSWIAASIPVIFSIFWDSASDSPTVIGAISLVVIGISFVLAIFSFIRAFLKLK